MQLLLKLLLNSFYGENIRKDVEEKFACKSEAWMMSEYDERVKDIRKYQVIFIFLKWLMTQDWKMKLKIEHYANILGSFCVIK